MGPRDLKEGKTVAVLRFSGAKEVVEKADLPPKVPQMLDDIHAKMFEK